MVIQSATELTSISPSGRASGRDTWFLARRQNLPIPLLMFHSLIDTIVRKRAIWGEFSWVVIGQAASVLGSIVGVRLLTDAIPPQVYGELALAMTTATLVNQIILGPLSNAYSRFYAPAEEAGELGSYLSSVARLTVLGGLSVISVGLGTVLGITSLGYATWVPLLIATVVFGIVSGCNSIMSGIQNAARHRSIVALHQGIASWLCFLSAVWIVGAFGVKVYTCYVGVLPGLIVRDCFSGLVFRAQSSPCRN